jgi:hypothetical protein
MKLDTLFSNILNLNSLDETQSKQSILKIIPLMKRFLYTDNEFKNEIVRFIASNDIEVFINEESINNVEKLAPGPTNVVLKKNDRILRIKLIFIRWMGEEGFERKLDISASELLRLITHQFLDNDIKNKVITIEVETLL